MICENVIYCVKPKLLYEDFSFSALIYMVSACALCHRRLTLRFARSTVGNGKKKKLTKMSLLKSCQSHINLLWMCISTGYFLTFAYDSL